MRDGGDGRGLPVLSMGGAGRRPGRPRFDLLPEVRAARGLQDRRRGAEAAGPLAGVRELFVYLSLVSLG